VVSGVREQRGDRSSALPWLGAAPPSINVSNESAPVSAGSAPLPVDSVLTAALSLSLSVSLLLLSLSLSLSLLLRFWSAGRLVRCSSPARACGGGGDCKTTGPARASVGTCTTFPGSPAGGDAVSVSGESNSDDGLLVVVCDNSPAKSLTKPLLAVSPVAGAAPAGCAVGASPCGVASSAAGLPAPSGFVAGHGLARSHAGCGPRTCAGPAGPRSCSRSRSRPAWGGRSPRWRGTVVGLPVTRGGMGGDGRPRTTTWERSGAVARTPAPCGACWAGARRCSVEARSCMRSRTPGSMGDGGSMARRRNAFTDALRRKPPLPPVLNRRTPAADCPRGGSLPAAPPPAPAPTRRLRPPGRTRLEEGAWGGVEAPPSPAAPGAAGVDPFDVSPRRASARSTCCRSRRCRRVGRDTERRRTGPKPPPPSLPRRSSLPTRARAGSTSTGMGDEDMVGHAATRKIHPPLAPGPAPQSPSPQSTRSRDDDHCNSSRSMCAPTRPNTEHTHAGVQGVHPAACLRCRKKKSCRSFLTQIIQI